MLDSMTFDPPVAVTLTFIDPSRNKRGFSDVERIEWHEDVVRLVSSNLPSGGLSYAVGDVSEVIVLDNSDEA